MSSLNPEGSVFFRSALNVSVARLPVDGTQLQFFLSGDDVRYFNSSVDKEQLLMAFAQVSHDFTPGWKGAFSLQYFYQDQVFDASITETNVTTLRPRGQTLRSRPTLRASFNADFWIEGELVGTRQYFESPLDDFWEGGAKLTLGRNYGNRSEATLAYQFSERFYDTRTPLTVGGAPIAGESLRFIQHGVELALRHNWDEKRRWQTVTRLGCLKNLDNGSGYFDYWKSYVRQMARYRGTKWGGRVEAKLLHYAYPIQTVSSTDARHRNRDDIIFSCGVERTLQEWLKVYVDFEHERALSNRAIERYHVNTLSGGLQFEF